MFRSFLKMVQVSEFQRLGIPCDFKEVYCSVSKQNVIRGLHFQTPPYDHEKLVYCVSGRVLDVVLDLRTSSATYGHHYAVELSGDNASAIFVARGFAHGFLSLSENAIVVYHVTSEYSRDHDSGILWNSANISWPCHNPILSDRDSGFAPFNVFSSPF